MKTVIIDGRMDNEGQRRLMLYGYNVITMPKIGSLGEAISSHPDTLLFKYKNELITSCEVAEAAPYIFSDIRELHPSVTVRFTADALEKAIPQIRFSTPFE